VEKINKLIVAVKNSEFFFFFFQKDEVTKEVKVAENGSRIK
jgi:hypothetical protein